MNDNWLFSLLRNTCSTRQQCAVTFHHQQHPWIEFCLFLKNCCACLAVRGPSVDVKDRFIFCNLICTLSVLVSVNFETPSKNLDPSCDAIN